MSMMQPVTQSSNLPLGTSGDHQCRFLLHHLPLALASAVVLVLFMSLPLFDAHAYPHADIVSGTFPKGQREDRAMDHGSGQSGGTNHERDQLMGHRGGQHHAASQAEPMDHRGGEAGSVGHRGHSGMEHSGSNTAPPQNGDVFLTRSMQQFTVATGYLGLGLLAVTLLIGPANLVLRRQNPVSSYLRRDVGIWTAIFSIVHGFCAVLIHASHGRGVVASFVHFFVTEDGTPLTNSFGWGSWTGLAGTAIALVLLVTSNDAALRNLKARPWKWLQRLNYALIVLVVLHAFFYGAFLRMTSPFTLLLILSVIAVVVGQAVGVWLWRRRSARTAATVA